MAYIHDRIAVAIPRMGVKLWMLNKGKPSVEAITIEQLADSVAFCEMNRSMAATAVNIASERDCYPIR